MASSWCGFVVPKIGPRSFFHHELEQRREKVDGCIVDHLTSFVQLEGRAQDRGSGL